MQFVRQKPRELRNLAEPSNVQDKDGKDKAEGKRQKARKKKQRPFTEVARCETCGLDFGFYGNNRALL